jgi:thiol-disulfide isomerase/thioredoxin
MKILSKYAVLAVVLTATFCVSAQNKSRIVKKILNNINAYTDYKIEFKKISIRTDSYDTFSQVYYSEVHNAGSKNEIAWHSVRNAKNNAGVLFAVTNQTGYATLFLKDSIYRVIETQEYFYNERYRDIYKPFLRKKHWFRNFVVKSADSNRIVLQIDDSVRTRINDLKTVWRSVWIIDAKTYMPISEENWYWYGGTLSLEIYQLNHITRLEKEKTGMIERRSDSMIAHIKTFTHVDTFAAARFKDFKKVREGDTAFLFSGLIQGGNDSFNLSDYKDSIIILDFFYTSCDPCTRSVPDLIQIQDKYAEKGIGVFGVDPYKWDWPRLRKFRVAYHMNYRVIQVDYSVSKEYGVIGYPGLFIIKNGIIVKMYTGYVEDFTNVLSKELDKLMIP